MNIVENKFKDKAIVHYGIIIYSKKDTLDFIAECYKHNIGVLGLDGFYLVGAAVQPSMEDSSDYSINPNIIDIYHDIINFVKSRSDKLYYEIVCVDNDTEMR